MTTKSRVAGGSAAGSDRAPVRRLPLLRYLVLVLGAGVPTGCAGDVVMQNPRTGQTETCQESLHGFDPWSQAMACVEAHEAQGWTRVDRE
jgi:hypothetical protein